MPTAGNKGSLTPIRLRFFLVSLAAGWTLCVALSLFINLKGTENEVAKLAYFTAVQSFEKDLLFRRWAARHGGVYVPITPDTPPNPYLQVPEREIATPSERQLTLLNPAYMIRQLNAMGAQGGGTKGHITSLKPLNPGNSPDLWERAALQRFEQGASEVSSIQILGDAPYLRLMRPLVAEKACLKCHAAQGYHEGDIRGGISVSVPLAPLTRAHKSSHQKLWQGHGLLWLFGLGGLGLGGSRLRRQVRDRAQNEAQLLRANRAMEALTQSQQALLYATDEEALLQEICHIAVDADRYRLAWVGYAELDPAQSVRPVAQAGFDEGYLAQLQATWADDERGQGPVGLALRSGQPAVFQDIRNDPRFAPWRDEALKRGYGSVLCLPLLDQHSPVQAHHPMGILAIYAAHPQAFDEAETALLAQLAKALAYGIKSLRSQQQRQFFEEALRDSEQRYRATMDATLMGIFVIQDNRFTYVNPEMVRLSGYSMEELLGRIDPTSLVIPEQREFIADNLRQRLQGVPGKPYEARGLRKDGSTLDIRLWSNLTELQGGPAVVASLVDISEQKRMEHELASVNERLHLALEGANDGLWDWDLDSGAAYFSPRLEEILGLKPGELAPTLAAWKERIHPDDQTKVKQALTAHLAGKTPQLRIEHRLLIKGGTWRWTLVRGKVIHWNAAGLPLRIAGTLTDIHERKLNEKQLHTLSLVVEQSPLMIAICDKNGMIEYINPKFSELSGLPPADLLDHNLNILASAQTPTDFYDSIYSRLRTGRIWQGECTNQKRDGSVFQVQVTLSPMKDSRGEISHFIAIEEDITERKKLEAQLIHAQKLEALGTLTGGIAHDFNNALTAILGYASLLQMKLGDSPMATLPGQIIGAVDRATQLTRGLLTYSRSQAMAPRSVDLNRIVDTFSKMIGRIIGEQVKVETLLYPQELSVLVDSTQLEQVLFNLTSNARDAMPQGGTLRLATDRCLLDASFIARHGFGEPGTYARLNLSDSGSGIDPAIADKIFDPFFTTKEVDKGTGLGLSISYGIVKQHKGYIIVADTSAHGTTFSIFLPLCGQQRSVTEDPAAPAQLQGTETILLIEDDPATRTMTRELLEEFGYNVLSAADGAKALQLFADHRQSIALVLSDVMLPGNNGLKITGEMRAMEPALKILFVSGYPAEILAGRGLPVGEFNYLMKPVLPQELLGRVRNLLDGDN